jgi:transcriptional/translational regulatory protein YebC/TACO1
MTNPSFIVECLTDNVNRSASDVKAAMTKGGAKPAEPGSVMFNFQRRGLVRLRAGGDGWLLVGLVSGPLV